MLGISKHNLTLAPAAIGAAIRGIGILGAGLLSLVTPVVEAQNKVGVIVPLSGALAGYGTAIRNGIELAKSENQEAFSGCEMVIEDSGYDSSKAIGAFRKLNQIDRVSLLYNFGGPTSAAIAPLAEKAALPTLLWTTDPTVAVGKNYVTRFANSSEEFASTLTRHLSSKGIKRIGIIVTENQYLKSMLAGVESALTADQSVTIIDAVQPGTTDFRPVVTRLRRESYDAIGVFLLSGQIGQFYRQLHEQNLAPVTFGTDFFEDSQEIGVATGQMEGAVYANNQVSASFANKYRQLFDNDVQLTYAGNGYDFALLACSTLKANHTAAEILTAFESTAERTGRLGRFGFVQTTKGDRYFRFPVVLNQIQGLSFQTILSSN